MSENASVDLTNAETDTGSSKRKSGRKPNAIRQHFTANGVYDKKKKRAPVQCSFCSQEFTASQAEVATLKHHLLFGCKKIPPETKRQVQQATAAQVNKDAAAAAAAGAAAGVSRKRSSSSTQLSIGHYLAGSDQNKLLPEEVKKANEHLLRAIVCSNLPFNVSCCDSLTASQHIAAVHPADMLLNTDAGVPAGCA
jgi:hypothetical protein